MRKKEFLALVENARVNDPAYAEYERNVRSALANTRLVRVEPAPAGSFVPGIPVAAGRGQVWRDTIVDNAKKVFYDNYAYAGEWEAFTYLDVLTEKKSNLRAIIKSKHARRMFDLYTNMKFNGLHKFAYFWRNTFFREFETINDLCETKIFPIYQKWLFIWMDYLDEKVCAKGGDPIDHIRPHKYEFNSAPLPLMFMFLPPKMTRRAIDDYRQMDYDLANTIDRLIKNNLIVFPTTD